MPPIQASETSPPTPDAPEVGTIESPAPAVPVEETPPPLSPADEPVTEEDSDTPGATPSATIEPRRLSAFERSRLWALGMGGLVREVEQARGAIADLEARLAEAQTALAARANQAAADAAALAAAQAAQAAAIAAAAQGREEEVSQQVAATLSAIGVPVEDAPPILDASAGGESPEELLARYAKMTGAARTAFFRANKAKLLAAEAAVTNKN